jgi:hypothetical protein
VWPGHDAVTASRFSLSESSPKALTANGTSVVKCSGLHPLPYFYQIRFLPHAFEQLPPHLIQILPHDEAHRSKHGARWPPTPGLPVPSWPGAKFALSPLVDMVLAQQNSDHGQHSNDLIPGYSWRCYFLGTELVSELIKLFSEPLIPDLMHAPHGFWHFPCDRAG